MKLTGRILYLTDDPGLLAAQINGEDLHYSGQALHYGVKAANFPLTEDDLEGEDLPKRLKAHRKKLFGLTIDPVRLQQIRSERKPNSRYATIEQCRKEVAIAETMFMAERIPSLNTTHTSIEEIASKVLAQFGIQKHMF